MLEGNLGISKNKGTFLWNFVPHSELRKIMETARQQSVESVVSSDKVVVLRYTTLIGRQRSRDHAY